MTSSYQRLKNQLRFGEQRQRELEQILRDIDAQLSAQGVVVRLPMRGIKGDEFLTDINTGRAEFGLTNIRGRLL